MERSTANPFQGSVFDSAVEQAMQNIVLDLYILGSFSRRTIDSPTFTAPPEIFIKKKINKSSLKQGRTEHRCRELVKAENETRPSSSRDGLNISARPPTDISDGEKINSWPHSDLRSAEQHKGSRKTDQRYNERRMRRSDFRHRRQSRSLSSRAAGVNKLVLWLKFLASISEKFRWSADNRFCRLIQRAKQNDEYTASKILKLRKKISVQMKNHSFSGKDSISVIDVSA